MRIKEDKPKVGQIVYVIAQKTRHDVDTPELKPVAVQTVGHKYFTVNISPNGDKWGIIKFDLETWTDVNDHNHQWEVYPTEQAYINHVEKNRIIEFIRKYHSTLLAEEFTLTELKTIESILNRILKEREEDAKNQ